MATRTISFNVESGGYTTGGADEWVQYDPIGNNGSFGNNIPTAIAITFASGTLYANYSGSITMQWTTKIKVGGTWYSLYSGSRTMSSSSSNFDLSTTSISSGLATALQSNSIDCIGVFQDGSRVIKGESTSTATCTITYTEVTATACTAPSSVKINDSSSDISTTNSTVTLSWSGASGGINNSIEGYGIYYTSSANGTNWDGWHEGWVVNSTSSSGSYTVSLGDAGTYRKFQVIAYGSAGGDYWSDPKESPVVYRSPNIPIIYNGTQLTKIIYNGTEIDHLIYNGTQLY